MIKFVPLEKVSELIENFNNNNPTEEGKFLTVEGNNYLAVCKTNRDAFKNKFSNMGDAIDWLNYMFFLSEFYERTRHHG